MAGTLQHLGSPSAGVTLCCNSRERPNAAPAAAAPPMRAGTGKAAATGPGVGSAGGAGGDKAGLAPQRASLTATTLHLWSPLSRAVR